MASGGSPRNQNRYDSPKQAKHYECRVARGLDQNQPELGRSLRQFEEATGDFVDYKWDKRGKELGELGVTLAMLEPVLRDVLDIPKGAIQREDLTRFEVGLKERMESARYKDRSIPLDAENPLGLYGKRKNQLALRLDSQDLRLPGERAMVERYIQNTYDRNDGGEVTNKFLSKKLQPLDPHITIGEINYDTLNSEETEALQENPTEFMRGQVSDHLDYLGDNFERGDTAQDILMLPDKVSLNGLQVFCQRRR